MGGKTQQSTSQVTVPADVLARYDAVNSQAQTVAQTPFQQYSSNPNSFVAPLDATQMGGILGSSQYSTTAQPFYQQASNTTNQALGTAGAAVNPSMTNYGTGLIAAGAGAANPTALTASNIQQYENPYLQQVVQPTSQLLEQQFNQAQSGQLGNAINNGAFGGDRSAITAANLQQQQALAYGQDIGQLYNQSYNTALGTAQQQQGVDLAAQQANLARAQQAGQSIGQLGLAQQGLGLQQASQIGALGAQQGALGAGAQSAGLQGAQSQLTAGQAQQQTEQAGLTALYNQFLQQESYPFQTAQFLANVAEGTGALSGSTNTTTQPAPFFSDERLKEDIKPIGETFDGQNIVKFRYKGEPHTRIGLVAQDVEKKHPEAVGLAGGYKTVDYDAATKDAEHRKGRAYGGLSPNSAWDAGFYVDPSYLQAQEEAYQNAPWGNAGPVTGLAPYGGKSHVPQSSPGPTRSLSVGHTPQAQPSGLQQLTQTAGQVEKLGEAGQKAWNQGKGLLGGNSSSGNMTPASPASTGFVPNQSTTTTTSPAPATGGVGSHLVTASNDNMDNEIAGPLVADNSMGGLGGDVGSALGDVFGAARGGLIPRHRDSGGGATDASQDDSSAGGDVPYDSGTGESGMDIPDDRPHYQLAVANSPSNSSGSGANPLGVASTVVSALGLLGLNGGGRVGLADGGDADIANMPIPSLSDGVSPDWPQPKADAQNSAPVGASKYTAQVPPSTKGGLAPSDYSSDPGAVTTPSIRVPNEPPGLAGSEQQGRGWLGANQDSWVPAARAIGKGLLTALSSNSRYGLVGIGQGIGAGLDTYGAAYEDTQNDLANRGLIGASTEQGLTHANETQAVTGNVQEQTRGQLLQNEATRQALTHGDMFNAGGQDYVTIDDGAGHPKNVLAAEWLTMNPRPPTYHQVHGAQGSAPQPGAPPNNPLGLGSSGTPNAAATADLQAKYPNLGPQGIKQADSEFTPMVVNQGGYRDQAKAISNPQEAQMASARNNALGAKQLLNQAAENIARMPDKGIGAPGALNPLMTALAYRWNGLVDTLGGNDSLKVRPDEVAGGFTQDKLQALQSFARTSGAGQHAFEALNSASQATAGLHMDKQSAARVLSSLYVDNQQDIDRWNYLQDYKNYIKDKGQGVFPGAYTAQGAMTGFANDGKVAKYSQDEPALERLLTDKANGAPIVSRFQQGMTPEQIRKVEGFYKSPGIFRYLTGGNQ